MKTALQIIHMVVCAGAIITGYIFLGKFNEHIENGIWDPSAITASAVTVCTMIAVAVHMTYYLSVHVAKRKKDK